MLLLDQFVGHAFQCHHLLEYCAEDRQTGNHILWPAVKGGHEDLLTLFGEN